jgi:hypothetical protein
MASEMRRAARTLVEPTPVRFVSEVDAGAATERVGAEVAARRRLDGDGRGDLVRIWEPGNESSLAAGRFEGRWVGSEGEYALEGHFLPSPRLQPFLRALSALLAALLIASGVVLLIPDVPAPIRFLVPLTAGFAILGFPLLIVALGSHKLAAEARIAKAIRALLKPDEV